MSDRCDLFLAAGYPVGVDIEKHLRGTMAQAILGVFDAGAVSREAAGVIVTEFVKGDINAIVLSGLAAGLAGGDGCRLTFLVLFHL